jgi:hypothetical protein
MLDRECLVPTPMMESKEPLESLILSLGQARGGSAVHALEELMCAAGKFASDQIEMLSEAICRIHREEMASLGPAEKRGFYQRVFEVTLKIYGFKDDWNFRLRKMKMHEKHRYRIEAGLYEEVPREPASGITGLCREFMANTEMICDRVNVLGYCLLSRMGVSGEYIGQDDIFYLIDYVYKNDPNVLVLWSRNVRYMNDWSLLSLQNYPDFLINELRYSSDMRAVTSAIRQKSHRLLNLTYVKLSMRLGEEEMIGLLIESYEETSAAYTQAIFNKIFEEDKRKGERFLKRFVLGTGCRSFGRLFYKRCHKIDRSYVETCLACIEDVHLISSETLAELMRSCYWVYLISRFDDFVVFMELIKKRGLDGAVKYSIIDDSFEITENNLRKIQYICSEMPGRRRQMATIIYRIIDRVYRIKYKLGKDNVVVVRERKSGRRAKPVEEDSLSGENIAIVYDIFFSLRRPSVSRRTIFKLSLIEPVLFCKKVVNEARYDSLFVKCMNFVLKHIESCFVWAISDILRMRVFNSDSYWDVAIRKSLKLKHLRKIVRKYDGKSSMGESRGNASDPAFVDKLTESLRLEYNPSEIEDLEKEFSEFLSLRDAKEAEARESEDASSTAPDLNALRDLRWLKLLTEDLWLKSLCVEMEAADRNRQAVDALMDLLRTSCRYPEGMAFSDSYIAIHHSLKLFSLQLLLSQHDEEGEQVFVRLEGESQSVRIGRKNGRLFMDRRVGGTKSYNLLSEDGSHRGRTEIESYFTGTSFLFKVNGRSHGCKIAEVRKVVIGSGLRGIVHGLLLAEGSKLSGFLLNYDTPSSFYMKELASIERALVYRNKVGLFMDDSSPYFMNGCIKMKTRNIFSNRNYLWESNTRLCELLREPDERIEGCGIC